MRDSILVELCKERCCADDVLGVVVANLLQRSKLAVTSGLL